MQRRGQQRRGQMAVAALAGWLTLAPFLTPAAADSGATWTSPRIRLEPVGGGTLAVGGVGEYRGAIELVPYGGGLSVVNDVGVEDYVRGIAEVPPSWPLEAQKAQAVAARSYALALAVRTTPTPFRAVGAQLCATQACQVYRGVDGERRAGGERWVAAVDATASQVLLHGDRPILAKYASSNGGRSEPGGYPWLPAVDDPHDAAVSPYARWRVAFPLADVAGVFPGPGVLVEANRAGDVFVLRRQQPDGTIVDEGLSGHQVREAVNGRLAAPPGLAVPVPSTRFVAWTEGDHVVLEGSGFGHLVGMSQYGALGKAQQGWTAPDILAAYYAGLRPVALPPDRLPPSLRVAVAHDRGAVAVRGTGRFRVLAADGAVLAPLADGTWTFRPGAGGVAVDPPDPQAAPAAVALSAPEAADAVVVQLAVPAAVRLRDPAGTVLADLGVLDAGRHRVPLTAPVSPGQRLDVVADADAGGGRTATATLTIAPPDDEPATPGVAARAATDPVVAAVPPPVAGTSGRAAVVAAALILVVAAALTRHRRPGRPPAAWGGTRARW